MNWRLAWLPLLSLIVGRDARAGDPAAETLFQAGKAALENGETNVACAKFAESLKLEPLPGTAYYLGDCEEKRGNLATAWAAFEEARQRLPASDERLPRVVARIGTLTPRLPMLLVRLASNSPPRAIIRRDGVPVGAGSLGQPIAVDPGKHVLTIEAEGYESRTTEVTSLEGKTETVVLEVGPRLAAKNEPPLVRGEDGGSTGTALTITGLIVGGLGIAGIGTGVGLGFVAKGQYDDADAGCPENRCDDASFTNRTDARSLGDVGTAVFAIGGGLAATGVVLTIVGLAMSSDAEAEAPSVGLVATPDALGATWSGTW